MISGIAAVLTVALSAAPSPLKEQKLSFGKFGAVTVYRASPQPKRVAIFISGDGGWNLGVVDMALALAQLDALVVGVNITRYLKQLSEDPAPCSSPTEDLEALRKFVEAELKYATDVPAILIGYSSGATLVYATLAQSEPTTFLGAVSLGFCPDLEVAKPLCRGHGPESKLRTPPAGARSTPDYDLTPDVALVPPWAVLQGTTDQVCDPKITEAFAKQIPKAQFISLPKVGHGFSVQRRWMPQFKAAFNAMAPP